MEKSEEPGIKTPLLEKNSASPGQNLPQLGLGKYLTVEPSVFLYFVGNLSLVILYDQYALSYIHKQNNFTERASNESCVRMTTDPSYIQEQDYQAQASSVIMLLTFASMLPSVFITVHLGGLADVAGRKVPLIWPLIGVTTRCVFSIIIVWLELPLEFLILSYLADGIGGGPSTFLVGAFAYISDVTSHENRSFRLFLIEIALSMGTLVSSIGMGYLIQALGYLYPFMILFGIHALNLLYICFMLRETITKQESVRYFTCQYFIRLFNLYCKNGHGRRWKLFLCLLILLLTCIPELGGTGVITLFQLDSPICFTSVDIGYWTAVRYVFISVSGVVATKMCSGCLGDTGLMILACISSMISYSLTAFVTSKLAMYLITVSAVCTTLGAPMIRSYCSKIVQRDEQGVLFSGLACAQTLSVPVGNIILNNVYSATIKPPSFKGSVFLVQAGILAIALFAVIFLMVGTRGQNNDQPIQTPVTEHTGDSSS